MGAPEANTTLIYGVHIRESANDGSDFSNAASDYRVLFLGEDGLLHVKDSAGSVSDPFSSGSGIAATIFDAKGDLIVATAADTAARKAAGANGSVLIASSGTSDGLKWTPGLLAHYALARATATTTENINSASYLDSFLTGFAHDWDVFPATHFQITAVANSNAAAQTITLQLTPFGSPTNPVSAAGDDLVIANNGGALTFADSGWIAVSDAMAGIDHLQLAMKGSNATVDLTYRWIDIAFKIAS